MKYSVPTTDRFRNGHERSSGIALAYLPRKAHNGAEERPDPPGVQTANEGEVR